MPVRYDQDTKAKAIRLVRVHAGDYPSEYAAITAVARRLRELAAELQDLSQAEMARAEGWATITPGTPIPPRTRPVRGPNPNYPKPPKTPGDQPA